MIPRHLQIALILMLLVAFGLGFYALQLKRRAEQTQQQADTRPVAPPVAGPTEPVTLWVAYDDEGVLRQRTVQIALPPEPAERARQALRALFAAYLEKPSPHSLGDGADVKDVYLVNDTTAVIDTNAAFADAHRSGVLVEELTVISMLQTFASALPKVTRVKILVDGHERETLAGHADLKAFYDLPTINQLAREMQ
ncbi:MAG TPA: GerMN domain-containing protein [Clostridia bacterium]|nr:GerMN domain-containing protein [Clostridia bacterium]